MGRVLKILAVWAVACWLAGAQAASWRQVPVPGAQVSDLVVLRDGLLYAGTNNGVYRSSDAGNTWAPTQGASPSKAFLRLHVVDQDPQKLVAYTHDGTRPGWFAIEVSRDGGATWQVAQTPWFHTENGSFASHPASPGVILFFNLSIVLRSEDGGMTWSDLSSNQSKRDIFAVSDQPARYVATTPSRGRLLESSDGGVSWTNLEMQPRIPDGDYLSFEQDPLQPSVLYFASYRYGSQEAASGKIDTRTGVVTSFVDVCGCSHIRVVADPHRAGRLVALSVAFDPESSAISGRPLRESLDGGVTWGDMGGLTRKLEDDYRWYFDPWQQGRVYLPTAGAGIYRSDNDGRTFSARYSGMKAGIVTDLSVDPTSPSDLLVVRQLLPMLHSSDGGDSFSLVRTDFYSDVPVSYEDRSRIARAWTDPSVLIGFDRNAFYRSQNGGRSWAILPSNFPFSEVWVNAIQFVGAGSSKIVALTERNEIGNQVYWSADGGEHWTATDLGGWVFVNRLGSGGDDAGPIYARRENYSPSSATLWKADIFGGAFRFAPAPLPGDMFRWIMSPPDPSNTSRVLFFSKDESTTERPNQVWETRDAGGTWSLLGSTNLSGGLPVVDACDGRTIWETAGGRVSRDSGRFFRPDVRIGQPFAGGFQALCFEGKSHLFSAANGGIAIREPEAADTLLKEGHDP
ncbi:hypothetical protein [Dokdonella koreensis]|uniref:Glycosyl hydrolase, BNR repeat-containing protein n=1 Tax=Dokdonella koreensis DS-123 TaxID=1300342 RepID=A0A160DXP1_9GAMM|nr:hypothetical protein [Dokdonella koreensis]ANB19140.1 Glycosyl hydrolase, BNR repeat-containing protein [Dokdonella koreensis DS-123]